MLPCSDTSANCGPKLVILKFSLGITASSCAEIEKAKRDNSNRLIFLIEYFFKQVGVCHAHAHITPVLNILKKTNCSIYFARWITLRLLIVKDAELSYINFPSAFFSPE